MSEKDKNVGPDDAPDKSSTVDPSGFFAEPMAFPPRYWTALRTVARFHHVDPKLLRGRVKPKKAPREQEFYSQLARVLLQEGGEPDDIWIGAKTLVAWTALEMDVGELVEEHESRRSGPKYKGTKAEEVVGDLTAKAIAAAAVVCEYAGYPLHHPGRPSRPTPEGASIEADLSAAEVPPGASWREAKPLYEELSG
jgi:hypothetical protein